MRRSALHTAGLFAGLLWAAPSMAQDDRQLQLMLNAYGPLMVKIETSGGPDEFCRSEGSGFLVGGKGDRMYVMTAAHVVPTHESCRDLLEVVAWPSLAPGTSVPLKVEFASANDVALLSAERISLPSTSLASLMTGGPPGLCSVDFGRPAVPIEPLIFIGYFPGDQSPLPYRGNIETSLQADGRQRIQGIANKGVSGGPVFNTRGEIIGMMRERVETDGYGNPVSGKAFITPVSVLLGEIATYALDPLGARDCMQPMVVAYATESASLRPAILRSTHQVAQMLDTHETATPGDLANWAADRLTGRTSTALRYPKQFEQRFSAATGYVFNRVLKTDVVSHNLRSEPLPTTDCRTSDDCIRISEDRKQLIVRYRLWSGPTIDRTRGWLEMVVVALQCRAGFDAVCNRDR